MKQERKTRQRTLKTEELDQHGLPIPDPKTSTEAMNKAERKKLAEDTEELLGEIDDVLNEFNAEAFVDAYVQRGGE